MKLSAFLDGTTPTMAVVLDGFLAPLVDVSLFYDDLDRWSAKAHEITAASVALTEVQLAPAVPRTAKVLCVGLNYKAHAEEGGREVPPHPNIFARWASTLAASGDDVPLPVGERQLDYEAELAAVIGRDVSGVSEADALSSVFAFACFNDITARGFQQATPQWALGKNADGSGPIGHLVTADEIPDPQVLGIRCRVNGEEMQSSTTSLMIYSVAKTIAYASGCLTLRPGDVIATGTPEGVGFRRKPPFFMHDGDVVEVEVDGVGVLTNRIANR